jgi:phage terminase large subunit-like protein
VTVQLTAQQREDLERKIELKRELERRASERKLAFFKPYEKQKAFFDLGLIKRERLLMAGNQLGKTYCGAAETAFHLTGEYPEWWKGRHWTHPVRGWAAGVSSNVVRDVQQMLLCGPIGVEEAFGTGLIPKDAFVGKPTLARGVSDAFDTIQVRHRSGGVSTLSFKSYEQGREKFQGSTLHFIWLDEEPDADIYTEALARITATRGMIFITFTPLKGITPLVAKFTEQHEESRGLVFMTIHEVGHLNAAERAEIIVGYPEHEREARTLGVPMLGTGAIFNIPESNIVEPTMENVPLHWRKLWGIDFGIAHPFAACLIAHDTDTDIVHVLSTVRVSGQTPLQHAYAMKQVGAAVPVAWPQDGTAREKSSGESLSSAYKKQGLLMLPDHATWPDGGVSTEAGVLEMVERFATGRLKVAAHLGDFLEEKRQYHRDKNGLIVKERDDILSATRIAIMMKRYARAVPLGNKSAKKPGSIMCQGIDFDLG